MKVITNDGTEMLVLKVKNIREARKSILYDFCELKEDDPERYEALKEDVNTLEKDEEFWPQNYVDCNSTYMIV